jgi:hypothetical protein
MYSTYKHVAYDGAGNGKRYQKVIKGMPHMSEDHMDLFIP